jgi:hypothetical protein
MPVFIRLYIMYLRNFCSHIVKEFEIFKLMLRISKILSHLICVSSGFRREVDENCVLPGCYGERSGNSLPTFGGNLSVPTSRGTDRLFRNVRKKLPLLSA